MLGVLKSSLNKLQSSFRGKKDSVSFILGYLDYLSNFDEDEIVNMDTFEDLEEVKEKLWGLVEKTSKSPELVRAYVNLILMMEKINPSEDSVKMLLKKVKEELENYYFGKSL